METDILIIGGGVNGTAIARDAAGRGFRVVLCERDDLASHTSSSSTKLIHGGLRYLEHMEFKLVREALIEREVLLKAAPHIIWPMRFVLPYDEDLRPAWVLRLGLFLYDSLGGRKELPDTQTVKLTKPPHEGVLEPRLTKGFEYSDCWVEDSRLVVLNAVDARRNGAEIWTRSNVKSVKLESGHYVARVSKAGQDVEITAKSVVNAAGPWVDRILDNLKPDPEADSLRLVKGSHIVTRKLFEGDHAYIFQNADNRIIFAIPYERDYTLIGTTDVPYGFEEGPPKISQDEVSYLCSAASEYLRVDITPDDVAWTYSGVRPLFDDKNENASAVTRDYVLHIDEFAQGAPFLSVYGGKITTSRKLAEHAMEKLDAFFKWDTQPWTREAALPGGDLDGRDFETFLNDLQQAWPELPPPLLRRLARAYGSRAHQILDGKSNLSDLGRMFAMYLSAAEVDYLVGKEWVTRAEDVLWRRTKLGLHMNREQRDEFTDWFRENYG